jgi:hypothetical protein
MCDQGGDTATCDADCTAVSCGDGYTNAAAGEQCDTTSNSASCDADCTLPRCGDGYLNPATGEACDQGVQNSDTVPDRCRTTCDLPRCGDAVRDTAEGCDDGTNDCSQQSNCQLGCTGLCFE